MEILEQRPLDLRELTPPDETWDVPDKMNRWLRRVSGRIREARKNAGLTQNELAAKSGLPQSHISRIENARHSPSHATREKIARALGIPVSRLDASAERGG